MNKQLYAIEPTLTQQGQWKALKARLHDLSEKWGINRMIVTDDEKRQFRKDMTFISNELLSLERDVLESMKAVSLQGAKEFNPLGGSQEVKEILGIKSE